MDQIQVHPTGFVDPADPDAKTKFLAAEALRGVGGLLIDNTGSRFVNEIDRRDYVTEKMQAVIAAGRGPVRLVLNKEAGEELKAHVDFYVSKGLMRRYEGVKELAWDMNADVETLTKTFEAHGRYAKQEAEDPFGKSEFRTLFLIFFGSSATEFFHHPMFPLEGPILVAQMTPVVHYVRVLS